MTLVLKSKKIVPITLDLAIRQRDMQALTGERELKSKRAKGQVKLLATGKFFTALWGEMDYHGADLRGNGRHTSHVIAACMQAHRDGLDEVSEQFVKDYLLTRGGLWSGESPDDLPVIRDKQLDACVEKFTGDDEADQVEFFRRYDSPDAKRENKDLLCIYIGQHADLKGLGVGKIGQALIGTLHAAKEEPEHFGFTDGRAITLQGEGRGLMLHQDKVRQCVRWIVETVSDASLYAKAAGAQNFAEVWAQHGPDMGEQVVQALETRLKNDEQAALLWHASLTRKHASQTRESLVKKGRRLIGQILDELNREAA